MLLSTFLSIALSTFPIFSHGSPPIHFPITRRGGPFFTTDLVNLTHLSEQLAAAEARFNLTQREMSGNKVIRKVKGNADAPKGLLGEIGRDGGWYTEIKLGEPPQTIQLDLDMLSSDFVLVSTTSHLGTPFLDYGSQSYVHGSGHPITNCWTPTDTFHAPSIGKSLKVEFGHCKYQKSSRGTLGPSGMVLGLAPSKSLSQIESPSLQEQLLEQNAVDDPIWSLMLINEQEGVLSIGGTSASAVESVRKQTEGQLDRIGGTEEDETPGTSDPQIQKRDTVAADEERPAEKEWERDWKWSKVQGAQGWWQILMQGVWVDGAKVLKNQHVILDFDIPFILAPPLAVKTFYASISGSHSLPPPFDAFHVFPCLNPPTLALEFDRWQFPVMHGSKGAGIWSGPGGKFSLGRLERGSGYCVGSVVETRMGLGDDLPRKGSRERQGTVAGNGLRDVWVLGESFWRSVGGVFDWKENRVGMRTF